MPKAIPEVVLWRKEGWWSAWNDTLHLGRRADGSFRLRLVRLLNDAPGTSCIYCSNPFRTGARLVHELRHLHKAPFRHAYDIPDVPALSLSEAIAALGQVWSFDPALAGTALRALAAELAKNDVNWAGVEEAGEEDEGASVLQSIPVEAWEKAFASQTAPVEQEAFESLVRQAAEAAGVELGTLLEDTYDPTEVVREVLDGCEVATVGLCFPNSTFGGDEIAVRISRFPENTVVGLLHSSWGPEPSIAIVLANPSLDAVRRDAEDAICDVYDCSEWEFFDEGKDVSESDGTPAQWYGFKQLEEKWQRRSTSKASSKK